MPNGKKLKLFLIVYFCCHPPLGGCGLKSEMQTQLMKESIMSPSTRRVWIEIKYLGKPSQPEPSHPPLGGCGLKCFQAVNLGFELLSPSTRRVWIEIPIFLDFGQFIFKSPSTRRVWIEIGIINGIGGIAGGHPPLGGCGLKYPRCKDSTSTYCHPPLGGCGLKSTADVQEVVRCKVTLHSEGVD